MSLGNIINLKSGANTYVERSELYNLYIAEIRNIPLLSRDEEFKLLDKYKETTNKEEKRNIRDKLLKHNQRFVVGTAKQYANNDVDLLLELISEANIAFMEAIDSYDSSKARIKLISWAAFYMRRAINIYLYRNKQMIRQAYDGLMHYELVKARSILTQREGREVSDEEILKYMSEERNFTVKKVSDVRQIQVTSIDSTIQEDDDFNNILVDFNNVSSNNNDCEKAMKNSDNKIMLEIAMSVLSNREKEVFNLMYALDGQPTEETMETIADKLDCSLERIRQLHNKGLKKMKEKLATYLKMSN